MRLALAAAFFVLCSAGCGDGGGTQSVTGPPPPATPPPAVYTATLSASSACARQLPAGEAVRVYEVTRSADCRLRWSGPTVIEPASHRQVSSLTVDGDSVSLAVGTPADPDSDAFNGISEELPGGRFLTISGHGSGRVEGSVMSGTFEGDFTSGYDSFGVRIICSSADHRFTLVPR